MFKNIFAPFFSGVAGALFVLLMASAFANEKNEAGYKKEGSEYANAESGIKDAWIDGKLEAAYLFNKHLNSFDIDTKVKGQVVHLGGSVDSEINKELAVNIAKRVEGVKGVQSESLRVEKSQRIKDSNNGDGIAQEKRWARAQNNENDFQRWVDDATITASVKTKLYADDLVEGTDINVDTTNNRVTLKGNVESEKVKRQAENIAKNTEDVVSVNNRLKVVPQN